MKEKWLRLISSFNTFERSDIINIERYYVDVIEHNYCSQNRHYHDLIHVNNLLDFSKEFDLNEKESSLIELAIWFHDVIYEPRSHDNEVNSGMIFMEFERDYLHLNSSDTIHVARLIYVTKHNIKTQNKLEDIMCDIDLKQLANAKVYDDMTKNVRKEFQHLSDVEWYYGRLNFIDSILAKNVIFHTEIYYESYEIKARYNLDGEKQEILKLLSHDKR